MAPWRNGVSSGVDSAVPPDSVDGVGKKKNQPMPLVVLQRVNRSDSAAILTRALDLVLRAAQAADGPPCPISPQIPPPESDKEEAT